MQALERNLKNKFNIPAVKLFGRWCVRHHQIVVFQLGHAVRPVRAEFGMVDKQNALLRTLERRALDFFLVKRTLVTIPV